MANRQKGRLLAAGSLVLVALAVVAVVALASGGGSEGGESGSKSGNRGAAAEQTGQAALVSNATPQPDWTPHTGPVPILEYHVLGPAPADAPYPELYVTRPDFHQQMDWLEEHGYEAVTLEQVEAA